MLNGYYDDWQAWHFMTDAHQEPKFPTVEHFKPLGAWNCWVFMDARSAMRPCYILPMFFYIFFMAALVGQTAERLFTKLSHVVDIRCYLRTY